ncbi:DUF551 domain-containing protein [Serratia marcescens]|nr:DUF551 domain-containing protein [Serratia marcescens]
MTLTTERQQFEEWFKFHSDEEECTNLLQRNSAGTNYLHHHTDLAWIAWKASRELLANREAQPVYQYRMRNPYNGQVTDWETIKPEQVDFILKETIAANVEFRIIAAPPAPAVAEEVIPGGLVYSSALPEFESNDSDKVIGYHCFISGQTRSVESQEQAYADAKTVINAFRATVLQNCASDEPSIDAGLTANKCENCASVNQPVSSGYKLNSPEIPDGWIACSEQMPEIEDEYYLTFSASPVGGVISVDFFFDGYFADQNVTHWMPLPEAPEGGNG